MTEDFDFRLEQIKKAHADSLAHESDTRRDFLSGWHALRVDAIVPRFDSAVRTFKELVKITAFASESECVLEIERGQRVFRLRYRKDTIDQRVVVSREIAGSPADTGKLEVRQVDVDRDVTAFLERSLPL